MGSDVTVGPAVTVLLDLVISEWPFTRVDLVDTKLFPDALNGFLCLLHSSSLTVDPVDVWRHHGATRLTTRFKSMEGFSAISCPYF